MRAFGIERPRLPVIMPRWDLDVVLRSFLRPPYVGRSGTDHTIEFRWRTIKTVFLLALATGRRVSLLANLCCDTVVHRHGSRRSIVLRPLPAFRDKNLGAEEIPPSIAVPGMAHLVPDSPQRFLCPVRAVRAYLIASNNMARESHQLFVHFSPGLRVRSSHISQWIMDAVRQAYSDRTFSGVSAHELRALAASWAYRSHVPLDAIKASMFWHTEGVFQRHYLRDMTSAAAGMATLGPVVVAGSVVPPVSD